MPISSVALNCRSCGALNLNVPQKNASPDENALLAVLGCLIAVAIIVAIIAIMFSGGGSSSSPKPQASNAVPIGNATVPADRAGFIAHINQLIKGDQESTTQAMALINERFPAEKLRNDTEVRALLARVIAADKVAGQSGTESEYAERVRTYWLPELANLSAEGIATPEQLWKVESAFEEFARHVEDGRQFEKGEAANARTTLIKAISAKQISLFPKLRAAYAAILDQQMWRLDVDVAALGAGNRTIRFTGARFAANQIIGDAQAEAARTLSSLRFTKASYEWFRGARQSQLYAMESPADGAVGAWKYGVFHEIAH